MKDFGDRINYLVTIGSKPSKKHFNPTKANEWLARANSSIRRRIIDRQTLNQSF